MKRFLFFSLLMMMVITAAAQKRSTVLTITVSSVEGDNLAGQGITITQTDYQVNYGALSLDAEGKCTVKVYSGNHNISIERDGFQPLSQDFTIAEGQTEASVAVSLTEATRTPFALKADVDHNVVTGNNTIQLSWNTEEPAFFDDFESYTGWSVNFGEWTGIDADNEAAAALLGVYPNRGVMQYAQIINPMTVEPTWWVDYPILRPYDGQQYVGFTRTSSGNANDDWLITPTITVGTANVFSFMAKAGDQFPERFMVYVTEQINSPVASDFTRIDLGNYEKADYTGWKEYSYDLSAYAGKKVKLAIRYVSHYNQNGSFMLMVDNVYVGQAQGAAARTNPNETFNVTLDGTLVGTTADYSYVIDNVAAGNHVVGVQARYLKAVSETANIDVKVAGEGFAKVTFNVSADSRLTPDGQSLAIVNKATAENVSIAIENGQAVLLSLPYGEYIASVAEGAFAAWQKDITVSGDMDVEVKLADNIIAPYNITVTANEEGNYMLRWNQELIFSDSFEDYDDFATGRFGDWITVDLDKQPVYPIGLGSATNIVSFPGSGSASNPKAIAPMVFNPWKTTPAMLPTDPAISAPTGDKTVIFFSPQMSKADKWLISPEIDIRDGYVLSVKAKAYAAAYPEKIDFCISNGSINPAEFTAISSVPSVTAEQWSQYDTDLAAFTGQTVRLAVHYQSFDAFILQIDDFTVGPENGQGEIVDYGNVVRYDIYVDDQFVGSSTTSEYQLPTLSAGKHIVGIVAVYQNAQSNRVNYEVMVNDLSSIHLAPSTFTPQSSAVFDLSGRRIDSKSNVRGLYIIREQGRVRKVLK